MARFTVTTMVVCVIILLTSLTHLMITASLLRIHYDCNEIPNVVKGSDYFEKVLYKQCIEDIFCPAAQRPYSLPNSIKMKEWLIASMVHTALCLVSSLWLACITIVDIWQAHMRVVLSVTYVCYLSNLGLDITIAREFALDYIRLTDVLDERVAGEGSNYSVDLMRIGTFIIVFAMLKGIVIHVVNVVLIITSIFLLPGHERLLRARKEGPIFGKLTSPMARRATALAAARRMAQAVVVRHEYLPDDDTQSAENRRTYLSPLQINSMEDLARSRRLQSMRARRARTAAHMANPTRQLRFEESPSPSPPPLPPPRKSCCTCSRRTRPRAPSPPPSPSPTSPTSPPSPQSPEIHATTITTVAVVEAIDMAVAGPTGLARASRSRESSEYITTEL